MSYCSHPQIRIYATSKYNVDNIQLLSRFYFQTRTKLNINEMDSDENDRNYSTVRSLHIAIAVFQSLLMPLFGILGAWVIAVIKKITKNYPDDDKNLKNHLKTFVRTGFFSKVLLLVLLVVLYIVTLVKLTHYSKITFNSVFISVTYILLSLFVIIFTTLTLICISCYGCCSDADNLRKSSDYFVTVMSFVLLGYFFPYMFISFIDNPLHSAFIYTILSVFIILINIPQIAWPFVVETFKEIEHKILFFFTIIFGALTFIYFLFILIALFTFASFTDFTDIKNIILPLFTTLIASLVLYYFRPLNHINMYNRINN